MRIYLRGMAIFYVIYGLYVVSLEKIGGPHSHDPLTHYHLFQAVGGITFQAVAVTLFLATCFDLDWLRSLAFVSKFALSGAWTCTVAIAVMFYGADPAKLILWCLVVFIQFLALPGRSYSSSDEKAVTDFYKGLKKVKQGEPFE